METLVKDLKQAADDVKKVAETTQTEVKNLGKVTDETKQKADEALVKHNEISERLSVIEQKMTQPDGRDDERQKSAGQMVAESDELKSFIAGGGKRRLSRPRPPPISHRPTGCSSALPSWMPKPLRVGRSLKPCAPTPRPMCAPSPTA